MTSRNRWASTLAPHTNARRPAGRRRIGRIAGAAVTALLASTLVPGALAPASAEVNFTAPLAANGFPTFFDDGNVKLRLCDTIAAGCLADLAGDPAAVPPVGGEAFWFNASAEGGALTLYEAGLEAAYNSDDGLPAAGTQIGANVLRFRLDGLAPNTIYTIQHPYGVNAFRSDATGRIVGDGGGFMCEFEPGGACDWPAVAAGFLGNHTVGATSFLKQDGAPLGTLGTDVPAAVTGAPSGLNAVVVTGPDAGGAGINTLTVSEFTVQGQIFQDAPGTPSTPDLIAAGDTGRSSTDNITNATLPTFTGTIAGFVPGTTPEVEVTLTENGSPVATGTTTNGVYTVTPTLSLGQGVRMIRAEAGPAASSPRKFTVDTTVPASANIADPRPAPISTDSTPTFNFTNVGTADTFECQLLPSLPTFEPCVSGKTFAAQVDGAYTFNVRAVDVAGNVSGPTSHALRIGAAVTRLSDFNRDGFTDLVARDKVGTLWLYAGNGRGGFLTRKAMATGWGVFNKIVTVGDVTGDGNADVVTRNAAGKLRLSSGNGVGGFATSRVIGTSGWNAMTAISGTGDMSGDKRPDVLARDNLGKLWLYPTTTTGSFLPRRLIGASGWNVMTAIMGAGDLNGDAKADLLARDNLGKLWVYPGTGIGQFNARTPAGTGWAGMTALVTPGNWDNTRGNDLIARGASGTLYLYPGNNAGKLSTRSQLGTGFNGYTIA